MLSYHQVMTLWQWPNTNGTHILITKIFHTNVVTTITTYNMRIFYQSVRWRDTTFLLVDYVKWNGLIKSEIITALFQALKKHLFGLGLCLSKCTAGALIWWKTISESLMMAPFQSGHAEVTIVKTTAPALDSNDTVKDFCKLLPDTLNEVPMLGYFNEQIHGNRIGMKSYNWLPWVCKHKLSLYINIL